VKTGRNSSEHSSFFILFEERKTLSLVKNEEGKRKKEEGTP
jgi:hypothetical protein